MYEDSKQSVLFEQSVHEIQTHLGLAAIQIWTGPSPLASRDRHLPLVARTATRDVRRRIRFKLFLGEVVTSWDDQTTASPPFLQRRSISHQPSESTVVVRALFRSTSECSDPQHPIVLPRCQYSITLGASTREQTCRPPPKSRALNAAGPRANHLAQGLLCCTPRPGGHTYRAPAPVNPVL